MHDVIYGESSSFLEFLAITIANLPDLPTGFLAGRESGHFRPRYRHLGTRERPAPRECPVLPGAPAEMKLYNSPHRPCAQRTYFTPYTNALSHPIPLGRDLVGLYNDPWNEFGN
jgi:hypothetical protein